MKTQLSKIASEIRSIKRELSNMKGTNKKSSANSVIKDFFKKYPNEISFRTQRFSGDLKDLYDSAAGEYYELVLNKYYFETYNNMKPEELYSVVPELKKEMLADAAAIESGRTDLEYFEAWFTGAFAGAYIAIQDDEDSRYWND